MSNRIAQVMFQTCRGSICHATAHVPPRTLRLTTPVGDWVRHGRIPLGTEQVLSELGLPRSGWEERLLLQCRRNMAVPPKRGQAVLFYNQHPDGRKDMASTVHVAYLEKDRR